MNTQEPHGHPGDDQEPGPDNRYPLTGLDAFIAMVRGGATIARECVLVWPVGNGPHPIHVGPRELFMRWDGVDLLWRVTERKDWEDEGFCGVDILSAWRIVPPEESDS